MVKTNYKMDTNNFGNDVFLKIIDSIEFLIKVSGIDL